MFKNIFQHFWNDVPKVSLHYRKPILPIKKKILKPSDAVKLLRKNYQNSNLELKEHLWVILLSKSNVVIGFSMISMGNFNTTIVDIRQITQMALLSNTAKVILCHNHTSETCSPSKSDIKITRKVKKALTLFEIGLMDHIIITSDSFFSFNDNAKL